MKIDYNFPTDKTKQTIYYNKTILNQLKMLIEQYPKLTFSQILNLYGFTQEKIMLEHPMKIVHRVHENFLLKIKGLKD